MTRLLLRLCAVLQAWTIRLPPALDRAGPARVLRYRLRLCRWLGFRLDRSLATLNTLT